jgi:phosphohistidine phosphatase SixA
VGAGRRPRVIESLAPDQSPENLIKDLKEIDKGCAILVGHEPELTKICRYFLSEHFKPSWKKISKGGAVRLTFTNKVEAKEASLIWYLKPKALRELGKSFSNSLPIVKKTILYDFSEQEKWTKVS